jgi:oxaloacetate decarboxylase alpha subunit
LHAEIDGTTVAIDIADGDGTGQVHVRVDGREYVLDVANPSPGLYAILVDGKIVNAYVALRRGKRDVHLGAWNTSVDVGPAQGRRPVTKAAGSLGGRQEISAPMSGRVVQVLVQSGQIVQQGETLVIVEAMKMETEIRSPIRGQVKDVHVQAGMAIEGGQRLLVVEGS